MISNRTSGLHALLVAVQIALALSLFAAFIALFSARDELDLGRYAIYGGVIALALGVECLRRTRPTVRKCVYERSLVRLHGIALRQTAVVLIALGLFQALLHSLHLSRLLLGTYLCALFVVLLFSNWLLPARLSRNFFRGARQHRLLLIGACQKQAELKYWLERKALFGFRTVGTLCRAEEEPVAGLPLLGQPHDLERVLREHDVTQVILLGLPLMADGYSFINHFCNLSGVRLLILSDLDERLRHPAIHVEDDGLQFVTARDEPLEDPLNRISKRTVDIVVSALVILFILPWVSAFVWLLHRLQSPGPLFYRQVRAGLHNDPFPILKFRSMHVHYGDAARQATLNDSRVFTAARWLRSRSLDELPQFINVFRGEMSVVGPRPHLVQHNYEFAELLSNYNLRAFVRPGITGLAQVRGLRGEATPEAIGSRLEADILYLENWTLLLDAGIILRTAWQLINPPATAV